MAADQSLWLLPDETALASLTTLVAELAPGFCGQAFMPHVTVQGDIDAPAATLRDGAAALAATTPALATRVLALEHGPHFFRCLLLRLEAGPGFEALQQASATLTGTRSGLSPYAHLSLAYGEATAAALATVPRAAIERVWVGRTLWLDRLALVRSSQSVPIGAWAPQVSFGLRR